MARKRRSGNYRMTPRRRAALQKAQMASARKRRRQKIAAVATVVGGIAATAAINRASFYANHPREAIRDYKDVKGFIDRKRGRGKDPNAPGMPRRVNMTSRRAVARGYYPGHIRVRSHAVAGRRIR